MWEPDATEVAYKNGYADGKSDAIKEIFEEINKSFYTRTFMETLVALKKKYTPVEDDDEDTE